MEVYAIIEVNNVPDYAVGYKYWVANLCESKLWFHGAWNEKDRADEVAKELGAVVVKNPMVE